MNCLYSYSLLFCDGSSRDELLVHFPTLISMMQEDLGEYLCVKHGIVVV